MAAVEKHTVSVTAGLTRPIKARVAEDLHSNLVADAFIAQAIELLDPLAREFEFRNLNVGLSSCRCVFLTRWNSVRTPWNSVSA
jgi:hypothetical protein